MPKKRSRSRSKERDREDRKTCKKLKLMQEQIDNLTKCMTEFIQSQKKENNTSDVLEANKENIPEISNKDSELSTNNSNFQLSPSSDVDIITPEDNIQESIEAPQDWNQEFLEMMGEELPSSNAITNIDETIQKQWTHWITKGLTEETRKGLLKKYSREGPLRTEAPKINMEIVSHLTEIAKKRDQHFADTQNCVGTGLISLGTAISMLMENPEEGVDHMQLMKYLWDTGKIMTDVFHQHSVARKSFITPNLDKDIKSTLEATDSDEWLYGIKLNEQVKDAKNIKKASASLKAPEKPPAKKPYLQPYHSYQPYQVNWRGPPARPRQVGYYPRRQFTNVRYKPKPFQTKSSQYPGRSTSQKQSRPASKK
ncbi:uncharacterized protein LOC134743348 [Cydia strobilella]|uniref:uncharacterized protein LOC134743348 n=1 Tax=Cydia strobilella TaxID=1100964 RepID=UPI003006A49C